VRSDCHTFSAWTTCPYIPKDGQRNPDVDDIPDATYLNDMPLAVLYNAFAYGLTLTPSYATTVVSFISTWFVNPDTMMNPNITYGQQIRGPPSSADAGQGQFMGIVDARGFVSVWNSIAILRTLGSPAWTSDLDASMTSWATSYMNWLVQSNLGQKAAQSPKYVYVLLSADIIRWLLFATLSERAHF
jgi:hypothetical protein